MPVKCKSIIIADTFIVMRGIEKFFIIDSFFSHKGQGNHPGDYYTDYCNLYHFYCFHHKYIAYAVDLNY